MRAPRAVVVFAEQAKPVTTTNRHRGNMAARAALDLELAQELAVDDARAVGAGVRVDGDTAYVLR